MPQPIRVSCALLAPPLALEAGVFSVVVGALPEMEAIGRPSVVLSIICAASDYGMQGKTLIRMCAGAENEEALVDLESLQFETAVEGDSPSLRSGLRRSRMKRPTLKVIVFIFTLKS